MTNLLPLPKHSMQRQYDPTLRACTLCQRPESARWSFYTSGRQSACHDCFLIHRSPDDTYVNLLILPGETQEQVEAELAGQQQRVHDVNDVDVLIFEMEQGLYDAGLDRLQAALTKRLTLIAQARAMVLNRGDVVTLGSNVRPQYLRGQQAIVDRLDGSNVWIHFDRTIGRIREGRSFALPGTAIVTAAQEGAE